MRGILSADVPVAARDVRMADARDTAERFAKHPLS
jgi:hypothetical protein